MKGCRADGEKLRALRISRQLRQKDLAERVGVRADTLCDIECSREQPSDLLAYRLAEALRCSIDDFTSKTNRRAVA